MFIGHVGAEEYCLTGMSLHSFIHLSRGVAPCGPLRRSGVVRSSGSHGLKALERSAPLQQDFQHGSGHQWMEWTYPVGLGVGLMGAGMLGVCPSCSALELLHQEPANALSLPTWVIHISSVVEWFTAMWLVWSYAEVANKPEWKGLTWGMLPLFAGALTACTWHFFYNSPDLEFLVAIQAFLTFFGNATCWIAAYRIYRASQPAQESS